MAITGHIGIEWLNRNAQRRYPMTGEASGKDTTGDFELPDDFLVYLDFPVAAGQNVDPSRFFIKQVNVYATGYSVVLGYQPAAGDALTVATALIARDSHVRNRSYALGGIDDFDDSVGRVAIGNLDNIDNQPQGSFDFTLDTAMLEPDAIRPMIRGVSALVVVNGTERSDPITGDVELVAGENMQILPVIQSGQDPIIRLSAIEGEGTIEDCICVDEGDDTPIRRLNGIPPTAAGDFAIVGDDCLEVQGIENGLRFADTCSRPCCGAEELEAITRDLERFGSQAVTLETFIVRLETSVTQMDLVVLGSRLNDAGCLEE